VVVSGISVVVEEMVVVGVAVVVAAVVVAAVVVAAVVVVVDVQIVLSGNVEVWGGYRKVWLLALILMP
jgi:hypothetical protein